MKKLLLVLAVLALLSCQLDGEDTGIGHVVNKWIDDSGTYTLYYLDIEINGVVLPLKVPEMIYDFWYFVGDMVTVTYEQENGEPVEIISISKEW